MKVKGVKDGPAQKMLNWHINHLPLKSPKEQITGENHLTCLFPHAPTCNDSLGRGIFPIQGEKMALITRDWYLGMK